MSFQIRYPNGERVPLVILNAEAANLWGIGIARDKVIWVYPKDKDPYKYDENNSWHELIGWSINHPVLKSGYQTWANVKETLFQGQLDAAEVWEKEAESIVEVIVSSVNWLLPYFELIDSWQSKGYKPVHIK